MKILILKPSSLGDVVHALPVLRLLKLHQPGSEIFWWLESSLVPLLEGDPDLAGVFSFERRRWASQWLQYRRTIVEMREERFDWAIDLQGLARSGLFAWLARPGLIMGLDNDREGRREGARMYYDLIAPRSAPGTHAVDRYLAVLPPLGVPVHDNFQWLPERPQVAARIQEKWALNSARCVALLPGARWQNKRWPIDHFVELARRLTTMPDVTVLVMGSAADHALGAAIAAVNPARCLDLTGQTSCWEMIECIRRCELVITNDTGPMHVAAALKRPVVALFGPTDPNATGPYGQRQNVLQTDGIECVPCMKDSCNFTRQLACLQDLAPAMVFERVQRQLNGAPRNVPDDIPSPQPLSPSDGERVSAGRVRGG